MRLQSVLNGEMDLAGLCCPATPPEQKRHAVGTLLYVAPEVFSRWYSEQVKQPSNEPPPIGTMNAAPPKPRLSGKSNSPPTPPCRGVGGGQWEGRGGRGEVCHATKSWFRWHCVHNCAIVVVVVEVSLSVVIVVVVMLVTADIRINRSTYVAR